MHLSKASFLKIMVADSQDLIDDKNLRLEMRGNREREPHIHPAAIIFDRRIEEFLDFGKSDDLVEFSADFALASFREWRH